MIRRIARWTGALLLWTVVALCLAATVVPAYLDRIYYRGPVSAHFDGKRFFNPDGDAPLPVRRSLSGMLTRAVLGDPDRPAWPTHAAVKRFRPAERVTGGDMVVTWIGHATLLVQADGVNILTDPVWSDTVGPMGIGPRRVAEPGVRFEDLPKIDIVVVSHNHYDHMDLPTLKRLWDRDRPLIVTSLGNDSVLRGAGIEAKALDWGTSVVSRGPGRIEIAPSARIDDCEDCRFGVAVTRNHHWGSRWFADRNRALWSSFVVQLFHGNFFFAGDTGLGDGKWPAEAAMLGPVRFAAIPIGAFRFEEGQMEADSHIGPPQAVRVWDGLGRPQALGMHWGTFRLSREAYDTPPRLLAEVLKCAGSDPARFATAAIGVPVHIAPLGTVPPVPDMRGVEACEKRGAFKGLR